MSDALGGDPHTAAGLFELLSDETRVRIVRELYHHWQRAPDDPCLPFSTLCARVEGDDSGRFNYHLNRLCGTLVDKREHGYALSPLGICLGQFVSEDGPAPIRV